MIYCLVAQGPQRVGKSSVITVATERAAWWLRSLMQRHGHLSYVCAGSRQAVIGQMLSKGGAFYGGFERLHIGPMDADHLATWIDARLEGAGIAAAVAFRLPRTDLDRRRSSPPSRSRDHGAT